MKRATSSVISLIVITSFFATTASVASNSGQAAVKLVNASATLSQTSDTQWTLKKTGEAGALTANSGLKFGDLTVCGLTSDTDLCGQSVRQVLGYMAGALTAGSHTDPLADLDSLIGQVNRSFDSGTPSTWAQQHLGSGACQ